MRTILHTPARFLITACLLASVLSVVAGVCTRALWVPRDEYELLGLANLAPGVDYVGDASCRKCHEEISDTYKRSEKGRSWNIPSAEQMYEITAGESEAGAEDTVRRFRYHVIEEAGTFFVEEYRVGSSGDKPHSLVRPISYILGSGSHGYSFLTEHGGFFTILPLSWYAESRNWDLSPGYHRDNPRFDREAPVQCVSCHNNYPEHVSGSRNCYRLPLPTAIGCERCHGPGALHVAEHTHDMRQDQPAVARSTIVNPAHLPVDRRDDVCLQCHLESNVQFLVAGKAWTDYRPGHRLRDFRHDLFLEPEDPARFGAASHPVRMRQSRCWSEGRTRGQLTCILCHDSHKPSSDLNSEWYVQKCLRCHDAADCRRDRSDASAREADNCIECHMPRGKPSNVAHAMFTDHWIRARPEPFTDRDQPEPPRQSKSRIKLIDFWEGREPTSLSVRAAAVARVSDRFGVPNPQEAANLLHLALESDPHNRDLQCLYGAMLGRLGRWKNAAEWYLKAVPSCDDPLWWYSLGEAQRKSGQLSEAVATLRSTIQRWPDFLDSYQELAQTYMDLDEPRTAAATLDQSLERYPYQGAVRVRRAELAYFGGESLPRVLALIDEARRLEPDSAPLLTILGRCLADQGDVAEAVRAFEMALEQKAQHVPALVGLGQVLLRTGRLTEAQSRLDQARAIQPNHPLLRQVQPELNRLRSANQPAGLE